MFLAEPPRTDYDLRFRAFGFPVRVHPFFWAAGVMLGVGFGRAKGVDLGTLLIWIAVMFASILVHELGHAFAFRHFGGRPWITLHGFGGLASCDQHDRSPRSQILIALAGPAAGFALAAIVAILLLATGHAVGFQFGWPFRFPSHAGDAVGVLNLLMGTFYWTALDNDRTGTLVAYLFQVNIYWGLINLLPVYPLDGGQVSRELLTLKDPSRGIVLSLQVSMYAAGAMAVLGLVVMKSLFAAFMFGYLAYSSYMALQAYRSSRWG